MKVLVAGANGQTGRLLIQYLREANHEPYGMVRKEEQKETIEQLGGTPVLADLTEEVGYAVRDVEAVIFAAGSGSSTGAEQTTAVDRDGAINLIKESDKFSNKKFIMLSSMMPNEPSQVSEQMQHYFQMKREADEYLTSTELNYTIVRPGHLTNEAGTSKIKAASQLEEGSIPRSDVAKTLIASLDETNTFHKTFEIISGETQIEDALKNL